MLKSSSGKAIISGHSDGSLVRYVFADDGSGETQVSFLYIYICSNSILFSSFSQLKYFESLNCVKKGPSLSSHIATLRTCLVPVRHRCRRLRQTNRRLHERRPRSTAVRLQQRSHRERVHGGYQQSKRSSGNRWQLQSTKNIDLVATQRPFRGERAKRDRKFLHNNFTIVEKGRLKASCGMYSYIYKFSI